MKHSKRITSLSLLAAGLFGLGLALMPLRAEAKTTQAAKTAKSAKATRATKLAKPGKPTAKTRKSAGPAVIHLPSPPAAVLARLTETAIQTGCLPLPLSDGLQTQLGISAQQLQALMQTPLQAAGGVDAEPSPKRCAPYATAFATAFLPGAQQLASAFAVLLADDRRALVANNLQIEGQSKASWQDLDSALPAVRELWLPSNALAGAGADGSDAVPPHLLHELGLLVKHMRQQTSAGDSALVRVLIQSPGSLAQDQEEESSLAAVELVDAFTGQALDSAVWVGRDSEPGAYISSRGVEYERMLWQAPVDFRRISRGIGASSMLVHKRVRVQLKAKKGRKPQSKLVVRAFQYKTQHIGIDFAAATGTPVVSVAEGEVLFSGWRGGYGNLVIVQHGSELSTYYGHLSAFSPELREGLKVRRGQQIGLVGSTGFSTGPHLHFEIRKGANYVDPTNPAQKLPVWTLLPQEREAVLTRLLQLQVTRSVSFMRLAHAQPQTQTQTQSAQ